MCSGVCVVVVVVVLLLVLVRGLLVNRELKQRTVWGVCMGDAVSGACREMVLILG